MAKVTDIQDKNGVSKEIQDKDLANRTSQSTVASTDYILLEDTDGAYHKIAKASFTEAVRGALGSVINSVAKGTDIAKVPVLDSNNDLGMGTLANLASVLGVDGLFSRTYKWGYNRETYQSDFEAWVKSAGNGIYIGGLGAGWMAILIGQKMSNTDIRFFIIKGNSLSAFCHAISSGDIIWDFHE